MRSLKPPIASYKHEFLNNKGLALGMIVTGAIFLSVGIYRFWVRPEHLTVPSFLGCVAGAFGAFFLLLLTEYLFHHAPWVFLPWFVFLVYFATIRPHLAVGLGLALWFMLATQLRG